MGVYHNAACMERHGGGAILVLCPCVDWTGSSCGYLVTVRINSCSLYIPHMLIGYRYNMFFVLYPLGIGSEAFLVYKSIPFAFQQNELVGYSLYAILGIYVPGEYRFRLSIDW
jgi:hypothetical protein